MDTSLMPLAGMNNAAEDAALQQGGDLPRVYARDIVNMDISPMGKAFLRPGVKRVTEIPYKHLWQSPLHRDTFAVLGEEWGKVDTLSWEFEPLVTIGEGPVSHEVLNNLVCVSGPSGIYTYDGAKAERLTIETPSPPYVSAINGTLKNGTYGVAIAWLKNGKESATSGIQFVELSGDQGLEVTLPFRFDEDITGARLYLTARNGGELQRAGDYTADQASITIQSMPERGASSQFLHKSPMPTGRYLRYWNGRLITAKANMLNFSEALAYHLHDERHGYVQMPQRITFVEPVDGGIWVGQVDHVAFLTGDGPDSISISRKTSCAPIPNSSVRVLAEVAGGELSQGSSQTVMWLASNGYCIGTPTGEVIETQAGVMKDISANSGMSVVLDRRVITAVT